MSPAMAFAEIDEFTPVVRRLRGSTLRIPNLDHIYGRWPQGFNIHYNRLVQVIECQLDALFQDKLYIKRVKLMDLAQFVCQAYPFAEWPKLRVMGLYLVGLILFDDEFDRKIDPNVADQASELTLANKYRQDMYSDVESIFLGDSAPKGRGVSTATHIRGFFATVAPHLLRAASHNVSIPQLLIDLQFFMGSSNEEQQRYTIWRKFPTLQQYNDFRRGTGAVDAICDLHQFVADTKLPAEIAWAEEVITMRREVNIQTCVSNDLLSLKKEIKDMTLISLIPIHMHERGTSLDEIVDELTQEMYRSAECFDVAAGALRGKAKPYGQEMVEETKRFIEVFETFQTGCLAFYIKSKRFGVSDCQLLDGSFSIPL